MNLAFRGIVAVCLAFAICVAAVSGRAQTQSQTPKTYTHPTLGYSIAVPDDAKVRIPKDGGNVDIAIDSGKGFGVILQSASAGPETSISEMAAMLEAAYLGPDKAWEQKVGQEVSLVSGLVSFNGYYEGGEASYRVVITRGQANTYTFVFRARTAVFSDLSSDFDGILAGFRPAPDDLPPEAPTAVAKTEAPPPSSPEPAPEPEPKPAQIQADPPPVATPPAPKAEVASVPVPDVPAIHRFSEGRLGYSVEYAPDWIVEHPSENAVMFSGPEGTDAFFATVSIQNVAPSNAESAVHAASLVVDEIRDQFRKEAENVVFDREGPYIFRKDGVFLLGREFIVDYAVNNERFRQWTVVVPRPEGRITYIWSYRAPRGTFRRFLPTAEAILNSWKIIKKAKNEHAAS